MKIVNYYDRNGISLIANLRTEENENPRWQETRDLKDLKGIEGVLIINPNLKEINNFNLISEKL